MFKKILVAFDGSDHATWALKKAMQIAKQQGSEIIVYYAIQHNFRSMRTLPIPFLTNFYQQDPLAVNEETEAMVYESHKNAGRRILKEAGDLLEKADIKHDLVLVENSGAVDAAKELVEAKAIDLVIVGARGVHSTLERLILGSVSSGIVNSVCSNILVMRSECLI